MHIFIKPRIKIILVSMVKKKTTRKAKPRKTKKKPVKRTRRPSDFDFDERMDHFGEEMEHVGKKFGKHMERKGKEMESWWYKTFGFVGPFFSSILSLVLIVVLVWVLNAVNLPFGNAFISNVSSFIMNNLAVFFAFSLFFSYSSYIHKRHRRAYLPVYPVAVAIGVTIGFWILMWAIKLVNLSFSNQILSNVSLFIQGNLLGIFTLFLFLGYLGLIIWVTLGKLNISEPDERYKEEDTMTKENKNQSGVKRLYRSGKDRILGGVCGGIAEYLEVDPVVIRILWVIFTLMYGAGLLAYIIAWIIIPRNPKHKWKK